jgi:CRP-like cAMP-binding protein
VSPEIISVLLGFVRDRLVDRITRTSELFEPFTEDERRALAQKFEVIEVDAGTQLITQGTRADGLYIVMAGKVEVARDRKAIATLMTGDVFGEMSLLAGRGSIASVVTATRVLALRMPAKTFREVIMTYPQVLAYLGDLSSRRSLLKQAEDLIDLHIDIL